MGLIFAAFHAHSFYLILKTFVFICEMPPFDGSCDGPMTAESPYKRLAYGGFVSVSPGEHTRSPWEV